VGADKPDAVERLVRDARPDEIGMRRALAVVQDRLFSHAPRPTISRYVVLERVATGGMGIVYAAYDPELDRKVALKLVHTSSTNDPAHRERLIREAQAAARISHPNVVSVFDAGTYYERELVAELTDDDTPGVFMVMEFVDGEHLGHWLEERERRWTEITARFLDAGRGLAAAHQQGMVHRDFKPANVMIGTDERVRVMDFGLARAATDEDEPISEKSPPMSGSFAQDITRTGATLGTPVYMSPEQHERGEVDARSDQFSFCVALYEALYGKTPFAGNRVEELAQAKLDGRIEPEPENTKVPQYLRAAIRRGLSPLTGDRFESMHPLLAELARDPGATRRKVITGVVGLALVTGVIAGSQAWEAHRQSSCDMHPGLFAGIWDEETRTQRRATYIGSGVAFAPDSWNFVERELNAYTNELSSSMQKNCRAGLEGIQSSEVTALRESCFADRMTELRVLDEMLNGTQRFVVSRAPFVVGELTPISDCSAKVVTKATADKPSAEETRALFRSRMLTALKEHEEAVAEADRALAHAEQRDSQLGMGRAMFMKGRAIRYSDGGDLDMALSLLERAVWTAEAAGDEPTVLWAGQDVAGLLSQDEANAREVERMVSSMIARAEHLDFGAPFVSRVYYLQGKALGQQGRHEEAADAFRHSAELRESTLGPHPATGNALWAAAEQFHELGRLDDARTYYERCIQIGERALGPDHPQVGRATFKLALVAWDYGELLESRRLAERSLVILEGSLPEHERAVNEVREWLALPQHEGARPDAQSGPSPDLASG
jgi:serine/threonine protein kinase/tetratricopeptide (TPR) repeat protein